MRCVVFYTQYLQELWSIVHGAKLWNDTNHLGGNTATWVG